MAAHALANADGGEEAGLVAAIVDAHLHAFDARAGRFRHQHGQQREREEAVCDGAAERRHLGHFLVDVDELVVTGRIGELVDHILINQHPIRTADDFADPACEFGRCNSAHVLLLFVCGYQIGRGFAPFRGG